MPKKMPRGSADEYGKALASDDPTKISQDDLERLALDAAKKFRSLK